MLHRSLRFPNKDTKVQLTACYTQRMVYRRGPFKIHTKTGVAVAKSDLSQRRIIYYIQSAAADILAVPNQQILPDIHWLFLLVNVNCCWTKHCNFCVWVGFRCFWNPVTFTAGHDSFNNIYRQGQGLICGSIYLFETEEAANFQSTQRNSKNKIDGLQEPTVRECCCGGIGNFFKFQR